jgi:Ca2+-binding EF-hand superfamily protein
MNRLLCALSVVGLLTLTADVSAKAKGAKGDKLEKLFKKLDTNGDGTLSQEEFAKITELRKKGGEAKGKGKGVEALFSKLDADGDGKLTLEEFRKITELRKKKKEDK